MTKRRKALGQYGEDLAAEFLQREGYRILHRNFRTRYGEIDLIVERHAAVHVVEVKTAHSTQAGDPLDWVTPRKQQQLVRMAQAYFARQGGCALPIIYFSVMAIDCMVDPPAITWLPDAFHA